MVMSRGNFADLLEPGLRNIFDVAVNRPRPMMERIYGVSTSSKYQEHYLGMGSMGLVPVFDGTVKYQDFNANYRTDIKNNTLALGMVVERDLYDDEQYGEITSRARQLAGSFDITVEYDAAELFYYAFTDSGTRRGGGPIAGADAVGLCSTAHPYSPVDSSATQTNEGTLALSLTNWNTTSIAMQKFTDDKANRLGVHPDTILVPPDLERTAVQIFGRGATWEPGSAEYDRNMYEGAVQVLVWNQLTDTNAWFAIDSRFMKQMLIWQWRVRPEFAQENDFDGITAKFRGYMRYGLGWIGWQWVYGQNAS